MVNDDVEARCSRLDTAQYKTKHTLIKRLGVALNYQGIVDHIAD